MQAPVEIQVARELDFEAQKVDLIAREVLGGNYMKLQIKNLELKEDFAALHSNLCADIEVTTSEGTKVIRIGGQGVGLVDAAFDGMMKAFAPEHVSLSAISIDDFSISIKFRGTQGRKSDAYAIALLRMRNSENHEYAFTYRTPSISQSSLAVVTEAVAFFVNSERAFIQLHVAVADAKSRNRFDLAERYQQQMAVLVTATSYKQVVANMNKAPKGV
jgi:hypothetical protein